MNIIKRIDNRSDAGFQQLAPALVEPVFLSRDELVRLAKTSPADKVIAYMAHQTARNPSDLQHHLSRIDIYSQHGDAEGVYGALLDLFVVLEEKGQALRKRLLQKFHTQLKPSHYSALIKRLGPSQIDHVPLPLAEKSMLGDGRTGMASLLVKQEPGSNTRNRDPVEDARDLINSGQIAKAQTLLEKILLINPQREDVGQELMIIYRHSHNHKAVEKVLQCTKNLALALRSEWEALGMLLKSETH